MEDEVKDLLEKGYKIIDELKALVDKDAEVFEPLSRAYGLPKDTPRTGRNKGRRTGKMLKTACSVPIEIMRKSYEGGIKIHERMGGQIGTRIAISDVAAALPS